MRVIALGMFLFAVTAAMPASAQLTRAMRDYSGTSHPTIRGDLRLPAPMNPNVESGASVSREVRDVREQIEDGRDAGQLSRREARALRREGRGIEAASARYGRDGYSYAELTMLRNRTEALRGRVVAKRTQGLQPK